jgi:glucan phosphoethanolaminetransferase (alkaline phosphatase superfamily)
MECVTKISACQIYLPESMLQKLASTFSFVCLFIDCLFVCFIVVCMLVCLPVCLFVCLFVCLCVVCLLFVSRFCIIYGITSGKLQICSVMQPRRSGVIMN